MGSFPNSGWIPSLEAQEYKGKSEEMPEVIKSIDIAEFGKLGNV